MPLTGRRRVMFLSTGACFGSLLLLSRVADACCCVSAATEERMGEHAAKVRALIVDCPECSAHTSVRVCRRSCDSTACCQLRIRCVRSLETGQPRGPHPRESYKLLALLLLCASADDSRRAARGQQDRRAGGESSDEVAVPRRRSCRAERVLPPRCASSSACVLPERRLRLTLALVLAGGKVFVNSGLFHVLKNEDSLAAVLFHEAAHGIARTSSVACFTLRAIA